LLGLRYALKDCEFNKPAFSFLPNRLENVAHSIEAARRYAPLVFIPLYPNLFLDCSGRESDLLNILIAKVKIVVHDACRNSVDAVHSCRGLFNLSLKRVRIGAPISL